MSVTIDSTTYDIGVRKLKRRIRFNWKYREPTQDGTMHGELRGVYYDYSLQFTTYIDEAEYALLIAKLSEAVEFHTVTVPNETGGTFTFSAYFNGVSDEALIERASTTYWNNLTVDFTSQSPKNTP